MSSEKALSQHKRKSAIFLRYRGGMEPKISQLFTLRMPTSLCFCYDYDYACACSYDNTSL